MTIRPVYVTSLELALDNLHITHVDAIKLDTQGSELDIIRGLDSSRLSRLLFVESEISLLNPPTYEGSPTLANISDYMAANGFQVANVRFSRPKSDVRYGISVTNECDVLWVRKPEQFTDVKTLTKLLALANLYYLYDYADSILSTIRQSPFGEHLFVDKLLAAQGELRIAQAGNLDRGSLSLWHRDR